MAITYVPIATTTVGAGGASTITFSSIPATYTDLIIKLSGRLSGSNQTVIVRMNNDTTSGNYPYIRLYGNGSVVSSAASFEGFMYTNVSGDTANSFGNSEIYIANYATTNNKSATADSVQETNATNNSNVLVAGKWQSSATVNTIALIPPTANTFVQYSTATLYGIKNTV